LESDQNKEYSPEEQYFEKTNNLTCQTYERIKTNSGKNKSGMTD